MPIKRYFLSCPLTMDKVIEKMDYFIILFLRNGDSIHYKGCLMNLFQIQKKNILHKQNFNRALFKIHRTNFYKLLKHFMIP